MDPLFVPKKIRTYTGNYVNVFNPTMSTLQIQDIAHSLSMQPRYGGHSPVFYSVAEHSVWVAQYLLDKGYSKHIAYCGLMHDASEAYLMDIPKPIKLELADYNRVEDHLMVKIGERFGFKYPEGQLNSPVKDADLRALKYEWKYIVTAKKPRKTLTQPKAKKLFLKMYEKLKVYAVYNEKINT